MTFINEKPATERPKGPPPSQYIYGHGDAYAYLGPRPLKLNCRNCGAPVQVPTTAIFANGIQVNAVACEYCGTKY